MQQSQATSINETKHEDKSRILVEILNHMFATQNDLGI